MYIKLSYAEAEFLKDQLAFWIEGYSDADDDDMPKTVVLELLSNRETSERIYGRIWKKLKRRNLLLHFLNNA